METLVAPSINLLILVSFLAYKLKKPMKDFVSERHTSIRDQIQNVREQLRQAQEKYDEFASRLKAVDAEIAILREQAKNDSAQMKQRIALESQRLANSVISDAKNTADGLYVELREQLFSEFGEKILGRAESLLCDRLTSDDQTRIRKEFSVQVESIQ